MALVQFYAVTAEKYDSLVNPNEDCLYFLDDGRLYKGSTLMGSNIQLVTSFPSEGEIGKIYFKSSTGNAKIWTGREYVDFTREYVESISNSSTNLQTPTAKAVWDLVKAAVPADYSELQDTVKGHSLVLSDITNSKSGILAKATALVKALEEGQVATNAENIESLKEGKANKATTIEGYGITDAYTKNEVDSAITSAVSTAGHLKRQIVTVLPSTSEADEFTIYMIKDSASSESNDLYIEYMLVNGLFEIIGSTKVGLSNYYTKTEVDTKITDTKTELKKYAEDEADAALSAANENLNNYKNAANQAIDANATAIEEILDEKTGILQQAKDYADSLGGLSEEDREKLNNALYSSDIKTGEVNGTINVKGKDIPVQGLGSAAYTSSSDYDPMGAASNALTAAKNYANGLVSWKSLS